MSWAAFLLIFLGIYSHHLLENHFEVPNPTWQALYDHLKETRYGYPGNSLTASRKTYCGHPWEHVEKSSATLRGSLLNTLLGPSERHYDPPDRHPPNTLRGVLFKHVTGAPETCCGDPLKHAAGTLQISSENPPNALQVFFKHILDALQNTLRGTLKLLLHQNKERTAKIHSRGQKINIFRPHLKGFAGAFSDLPPDRRIERGEVVSSCLTHSCVCIYKIQSFL